VACLFYFSGHGIEQRSNKLVERGLPLNGAHWDLAHCKYLESFSSRADAHGVNTAVVGRTSQRRRGEAAGDLPLDFVGQATALTFDEAGDLAFGMRPPLGGERCANPVQNVSRPCEDAA